MKERYLGLGLHGEGPTDQRFLAPLLARLTSSLVTQYGSYPVREMEAWVIADPGAIAGLLRSKLDAAALGLPDDPTECESVADPKAALERAMARARSKTRRRRGQITYEPLGERVDLARLAQLDAFRTLRDNLRHELTELRILARETP